MLEWVPHDHDLVGPTNRISDGAFLVFAIHKMHMYFNTYWEQLDDLLLRVAIENLDLQFLSTAQFVGGLSNAWQLPIKGNKGWDDVVG